jgi:predicted dehydrogenase
MNRTLRIGIIGTGIAARELHWPALRTMPDRFEIVALCNRTREKAQEFATLIGQAPRITTDYRELLAWPEVDAVDIALPIALNEEVTLSALRAGKHVFLEKPIAGDVHGGRRVVAAAEEQRNLVLLVAENVRYEARFLEARRLIGEGCIGRPIMLHADVLEPLAADSPYVATSWRVTPEHLGGYLSDGGVHKVAALHLLGGPITAVQGMITTFRPNEDPTDTLLANLRFASGAVGHLTYSVGVESAQPTVYRVFGSEGTMEVHDTGFSVTNSCGRTDIDLSNAPDPYALELLDFHRAVTEGTVPAVTPQDALADLAVLDTTFRSWRSGSTQYPE